MWNAESLHVLGVRQHTEICDEVGLLLWWHQGMDEDESRNALVNRIQRGIDGSDDDEIYWEVRTKSEGECTSLNRIGLNKKNRTHRAWTSHSILTPYGGTPPGSSRLARLVPGCDACFAESLTCRDLKTNGCSQKVTRRPMNLMPCSIPEHD
jgi:hypothetical protein